MQIESGALRAAGKRHQQFSGHPAAAAVRPRPADVKDPYIFDFLTLAENAQERDIERALLGTPREFLIELGVGFAFVGSQYRLEVGGEDFYLDLLFYHLKLRCFVVID